MTVVTDIVSVAGATAPRSYQVISGSAAWQRTRYLCRHNNEGPITWSVVAPHFRLLRKHRENKDYHLNGTSAGTRVLDGWTEKIDTVQYSQWDMVQVSTYRLFPTRWRHAWPICTCRLCIVPGLNPSQSLPSHTDGSMIFIFNSAVFPIDLFQVTDIKVFKEHMYVCLSEFKQTHWVLSNSLQF